MKDRFNLIAAVAFMLVVATIGGASRADAMSQTPLRLLALAFLVAGLWAPNRVRLSRYRPLFWFLGLAAFIPALQLIPLPYEIWSGLPGREFYIGVTEALDLPRSSRPISLTPGLTWNALLSLLVPGAMLVLATQVPVDRLSKLAVATLGIVFVGVVLGFAQIAGGPESGLRFYRVTNGDSMVGLFANRNHHAVLVAMALPIVFALPIGLRANQVWRRIGLPLSALGVLLIGIALFLTGSRAGLLAGALGALGGAAIYGSMASAHQQARLASDSPAPRSWRERLRHPVAAPIAALSMIAVAAAGFASTPAMQRLLKTNVAEEDRAKFFGPILELTGDLLPFGGGFGSFNNLFRKVESVEGLKTVYLNHAHMDLVQIVTEGGWPAAALFVAFMVWWTRCAINAWRQPRSVRFGDNLGRIATVSTGVVILASAVDYPLRTPLHMALFVVSCVWLQRAGSRITPR